MRKPKGDPTDFWTNKIFADDTKTREQKEGLIDLARRMGLNEYIPYWPSPLQIAMRLRQEKEGLIGGEPRAGKTVSLLIDNICDATVPGFTAIFFRETKTELKRANGLIDTCRQWFANFPEWKYSEELMEWRNSRYDSTFVFAFLGQKGDEDNHLGFEYQSENYEELTRLPFNLEWNPYLSFFHRLNKPRDMQVKVRVRATANPGGSNEQFVMNYFLSPHAKRYELGGEVGHESYLLVMPPRADPDPNKDFGGRFYLHAQIEDNPAIDAHAYRSNLALMDEVTQAQMGKGMWGVARKGNVFDTDKIKKVPSVPWMVLGRRRGWDKASSIAPLSMPRRQRLPPRSAGVRISRLAPGAAARMWGSDFEKIEFVLEHSVAGYWTPTQREAYIDIVAGGGYIPDKNGLDRYWEGDGFGTWIDHEQEPGSGGMESAEETTKRLVRLGYSVQQTPARMNKETRAAPLASAVGNGMVGIVTDGSFDTDELLGELAGFPKGARVDLVDAAALCYLQLVKMVPSEGALAGGELPYDIQAGYRPHESFGQSIEQQLISALRGWR